MFSLSVPPRELLRVTNAVAQDKMLTYESVLHTK